MQQEMASRIEETITHTGVLIAECGTGTGKTFAYLVPALLSGRKTLISTGTKHLQDQLFQRDLPLVREALEVGVNTAVLKGRANYLCLDRLARAQTPDMAPGEATRRQLERVSAWSVRTRYGEVGELTDIPEDAAIWPLVTSTNDNCLGGKCAVFDRCHVNRARKAALKAEVLVVNHHLFFADLALREDGFGNLLPGVEIVIFDEAHQLPSVASNFLGNSITGAQLSELCRDTVAEETRDKSRVAGLGSRGRRVERAIAELRLSLEPPVRRFEWDELVARAKVRAALSGVLSALDGLAEALQEAAAAGEGLARCRDRCVDLHGRLFEFAEDPRPEERVRWAETTPRSFRFHETPLHIGRVLHGYFGDRSKSWVFTSATLSVAGDFSHYQGQIGVADADTGRWQSPFDFAAQALLYIPEQLPEPRDPAHTQAVVRCVAPVLEASGGRAFVLFTSYRAMHEAYELLRSREDFSLLMQGSAPKSELLGRFRDGSRAVLLGTASFWEGVDVRGDALSCVIIDKLPFEAPDDPVLRARLGAIERAGGNPFMDHQLPHAVIALQQGFGRLIRDVSDRGVLMLCDPRVLTRNYGRWFLDSLPPMPRTRDLSAVRRFYAGDR